jgi:hypothetical protein
MTESVQMSVSRDQFSFRSCARCRPPRARAAELHLTHSWARVGDKVRQFCFDIGIFPARSSSRTTSTGTIVGAARKK